MCCETWCFLVPWSLVEVSVFGSSSGIAPLQVPGRGSVCLQGWVFELLVWQQTVPAWLLYCRPHVILGLVFVNSPSDIVKFLDCCCTWMGVIVVIPLDFRPLFSGDCIGVLALKLSRNFRFLLSRGLFPQQWRRAVITPIPKGPLSSLVSGYRSISLTPILSKIYERLISPRLSCLMERSGLFPSHQYSYRKGVGLWVLEMHYCILCVLARASWMVAGSLQ